MKLKKDNVVRVLTDKDTIKIFKDNGWEEVKEPEIKPLPKKGAK